MTVDEVIDLLENNLLLDVAGPDDDLIDSGELDSLRFVELVLAIEQQHGIRLKVAELDLDDLRTPASIAVALTPLLEQAI